MSPFASLKKAVGEQVPKPQGGDARAALAQKLRENGERMIVAITKALQAMAGTATKIEGSLAGFAFDKVKAVIASHRVDGAAGLIELDGASTPLLALIDATLVHAIVELLCGGDGSEEPSATPREATGIDQQFAQIIFSQAAAAIQAEWADLDFGTARAVRIDGILTPDLFGPQVEHVGIINMTVGIFGLHGGMRLMLPPSVLERFGGAPAPARVRDGNSMWTADLRQEIDRVPVSLTAYLDAKELPLATIARLEVGQVLHLPLDAGAHVGLSADGRMLFRGELGQDEGRYSVRVDGAAQDGAPAPQVVAHRFSHLETFEVVP